MHKLALRLERNVRHVTPRGTQMKTRTSRDIVVNKYLVRYKRYVEQHQLLPSNISAAL